MWPLKKLVLWHPVDPTPWRPCPALYNLLESLVCWKYLHPAETLPLLAVQADAALVQREPALLTEFEAAPWLLPAGTKSLPYAGIHDLDRLLAMRAAPAGGHDKTVALLAFGKNFAELFQNCCKLRTCRCCCVAVLPHASECMA